MCPLDRVWAPPPAMPALPAMPASMPASVPVMLLNSENSQHTRRDEQAFLEALECGALVIVRGAAHAALDDPQSFNEHVASADV